MISKPSSAIVLGGGRWSGGFQKWSVGGIPVHEATPVLLSASEEPFPLSCREFDRKLRAGCNSRPGSVSFPLCDVGRSLPRLWASAFSLGAGLEGSTGRPSKHRPQNLATLHTLHTPAQGE